MNKPMLHIFFLMVIAIFHSCEEDNGSGVYSGYPLLDELEIGNEESWYYDKDSTRMIETLPLDVHKVNIEGKDVVIYRPNLSSSQHIRDLLRYTRENKQVKDSSIKTLGNNDYFISGNGSIGSRFHELKENRNDGIDFNWEQSKLLSQLQLRAMHKKDTYETGKQHTLLVEVVNDGDYVDVADISVLLPKQWRLISVASLGTLERGAKKIMPISFFIPSNAKAGRSSSRILLKAPTGTPLAISEIEFKVGPNYNIDVFNVKAPQNVQAGDTIFTTFAIKNEGNTEQKLFLRSRNTIIGNASLTIAPDSIAIVGLYQKTDGQSQSLRVVSTHLEVTNQSNGKKKVAFKSVEVFPTKIGRKDPFFRFPMRASVLYNSYTAKDDHFSTMSFEVSGNGYLDVGKHHYLDFIIRGPRQENLKRFGVSDQYSLLYKNRNVTTVQLGDHPFYTNRLGILGKFGMGFRIDQNVKDWTLSGFYTKPRLYDFNDESVYGFQTKYKVNDSLTAGLSLVRTKRTDPLPNERRGPDMEEQGQIVTVDLAYQNKSTLVEVESAVSATNKHIDVANFFSLRKTLQNFSYSGSLTLTGKEYFGTISNSIQLNNALYYSQRKWNLGIGQNLSRVNQRLNPLFYAAEPYFENYYATLGHRFRKKHYINFRLDRRIREDRLEVKNYHYKEYGLNYGYTFNDNDFSANFYGRLGRTKNLLRDETMYNNTYSHNLNLSYKFAENIRLRGGVNHIYSNRYGNTNANTNFVRYSVGLNYRLNRDLRVNGSFNSGFSPEENYLRRDFINLNVFARIHRNHLMEVRANYFENPGITNRKEILAFAKYTYTFGAPLKKVIDEGGLVGEVVAGSDAINTKGVKIIAAGKTVVTDKNGLFEINNLPTGKNYILVDQSSLQDNVITSSKIPYEVTIESDKKSFLTVRLVKSASVQGRLHVVSQTLNSKNYRLNGFLKLHNQDFTYYTESDASGVFNFHQIVPGTYELTLLRLKENDNLFRSNRSVQLIIEEDTTVETKIDLQMKQRIIKFKNKNIKVGSYEIQ